MVRGLILLAWSAMATLGGATAHGADLSHERGKIKVDPLKEISGLAASRQNRGVLWLHNDGDSGQVFGVSTTGRLAALVRTPVRVEDVEEIALGPGPEQGIEYLYLGDIGDNDERRREIRVVRFREPNLGGKRGQMIDVAEADEIRLVYPDGPHNAEAMFVDPRTGDLYIVTKEQGRARLYTVTSDRLQDQALARLTSAGDVDAEQVSAGAISPSGEHVILRREAEGWLWVRRAGESVVAALGRKPLEVQVRGKRQGPNGEAVAFSPAGNSYYTVSEGKKQAVYEFDLPDAAGALAP